MNKKFFEWHEIACIFPVMNSSVKFKDTQKYSVETVKNFDDVIDFFNLWLSLRISMLEIRIS